LALIFWCSVTSAQESSWEETTKAAKFAEIQGRPTEARRFYQDAISEAEALGPEDWRLATAIADLGAFYFRQTNYSGAEMLLRRALEIRLTSEPNSFEEVSSARVNLAGVLLAEGKDQEAETLYLKAVEEATTSGKEPLQLAATLEGLARFYQGQRKLSDAERLYERVVAIQTENLESGSGVILGTVERLGVLYEEDGKVAEVEALYLSSIERKMALPRGHLSLIASLNDLAEFLEHQERFTEAETYYERALHQFPTTVASGKDSNVAVVMRNYARVLRKMNRANEAAQYENDADTFDPRLDKKGRLIGDLDDRTPSITVQTCRGAGWEIRFALAILGSVAF
jgi:tetratricopeptide (TPR) repeat protein